MTMESHMPVRTIDIELSIMYHFNFRQNLIVPNITNMVGIVPFETDILVLTKNNRAYGFEIKVSKADLKADFKKPQHKQDTKAGFERYYGKFKYFYYAVPFNLKEAALQIIPEFCGLICIEKIKHDTYTRKRFEVSREPKQLFDYRWTEAEKYEVARLGAMRQYNLMQAIANK